MSKNSYMAASKSGNTSATFEVEDLETAGGTIFRFEFPGAPCSIYAYLSPEGYPMVAVRDVLLSIGLDATAAKVELDGTRRVSYKPGAGNILLFAPADHVSSKLIPELKVTDGAKAVLKGAVKLLSSTIKAASEGAFDGLVVKPCTNEHRTYKKGRSKAEAKGKAKDVDIRLCFAMRKLMEYRGWETADEAAAEITHLSKRQVTADQVTALIEECPVRLPGLTAEYIINLFEVESVHEKKRKEPDEEDSTADEQGEPGEAPFEPAVDDQVDLLGVAPESIMDRLRQIGSDSEVHAILGRVIELRQRCNAVIEGICALRGIKPL